MNSFYYNSPMRSNENIAEDFQEEDLHEFFYGFEDEPFEGLTVKNIYEEAEKDSIWIE
ncbi:MAG: hypothetical protein GY760_14115 [Deltaproteobacteria bacterium]|nr:hypothetical protein [Deltaproteobacteria bacterium]